MRSLCFWQSLCNMQLLFSGSVYSSASSSLPPQPSLSVRRRQDCALSGAASHYKAQICLGTHGSELSNKTGIAPRHNGSVKSNRRRGEDIQGGRCMRGAVTRGAMILLVRFLGQKYQTAKVYFRRKGQTFL